MASERPNNTPFAAEWLAFEEQTGGRFVTHGTVHEMREQFSGQISKLNSMLPPPSDNVSSEDHRTSEGVLVRVYKPKDAASDLPIGLYIHSGGWACGDYIAEDHLIRQIAQSVPCVLVSVEYRLAPENPFPAALEDCFAAYGWMAKSAKQLGGDASKLFFVGGSAGGNLSLTTTLKVLDDGDPSIRPKGVFALCPAVAAIAAVDELPEELKQYEHPDAYEGTAMIDKAAVVTCGNAYIGSSSPSDPLISPIFHPKLSQLPYVYLTTSNKDPLNDDALMFQHKLKAEGVQHTLNEYDGYPHFFHLLPHLEMSLKFMTDLTMAIRERCS
ncbi:hypothetical protein LTR37_005684 [Vermiconidia calcicola]|uniref:Uncharacterized protein n=1 Tax=Vermiconidia calcicola TaxID=1690605 RepID=A0ACC3NJI0_9PEZI|nr:hypothetical protein LTR37_005684 [Vermiconidia calcicola]